jgi:hypothetical protein
MGPDPISLALFILKSLKAGGQISASKYEIRIYRTKLEMTSDRFARVESAYKSTLCTRSTNARIGRELQRIRSILDDAERAVSWITNDKASRRNFVVGNFVAWYIVYKQIAGANTKMLDLCNETLRDIKAELDRDGEALSQEKIYFKETRSQTWATLSKRAKRNEILYSRVEEQDILDLTVSFLHLIFVSNLGR